MLQTSLFKSLPALYFFWAVLILFSLSFICIRFLQSGKKHEWVGVLSKFTNLLLNLLVGIMLYPMASNFGSFWSCDEWSHSHGFVTMKTCHNDLVYPLFATCTFLYLLFIVYLHSFVTEYLYYDITYISVSFSRFTTLELFLTSTIIFLMSALTSAFKSFPISSIGLNIASLICNSLVMCCYIYYHPFYMHRIGTFKIGYASLLAWLSFSALFLEIFASSGYECNIPNVI